MEGVLSILYKVSEAIIMAKKMDKKLREYKNDYDKNMWERIG